MENDLHQAFYGVFCSSKEIIKNKQRHLYANMLDLLGRTCKATGLAENVIGQDNLVKFWLDDILPLVFDSDKTIQSCAVNTIEQGLNLMKISTIHSSKYWPELRNTLVTTLPSKIHELRSGKNKHWHQIWCLVIKILDREILNGATIINSFLSAVELGFRSSDSSVRAETFLCWKLLIQIFHSYNELLTPKRLKLICIPLKSTQSKSPHLANIKIRVWWYFISCIDDKLNEHFSKVVEPFLTYVFGAPNREATGDVQQYESVQILAVLCLAQLLAEDQDDFIDILITENELDTLIRPSPILKLDTLKENWHQISHVVMSAVKLFGNSEEDSENHDAKQHLRNWLVLRIVKIMLHVNLAPFTQEICENLISFLPTQTLPISTALNCLANDGINLDPTSFDAKQFSDNLNALLSLIVSGKALVTLGVLNRCIEQIAKLPHRFDREQNQQQAMCATIKVICSLKDDDDDFDAFETRLLCWKRVAQTIINHLSDKILYYRRKDIAEVFNEFIVWPLRQFDAFAGRRCTTMSFDEDFCAFWRQLLLCGQNAPEREKFLQDVQKTLRDLAKPGKCELPLPELVNAYVVAVLKFDTGKDSKYISEILQFLRDLIEQPKIVETKAFEGYLNTLRNVYLHMKNSEVMENFELVKASIAHVVGIVAKSKPAVNTKVFNEWKQGILERFRTIPQKNYLTQIKDIFKNEDVFIIIPNLWILKPEKLTERQKERFAERSDIPALYNDMSQSQDSSIKPWTPNKVVLAKKDQTEIVIGSSQIDENEDRSDALKNIKPGGNSPIEVRATRRRSIKIASTQSESEGKSKLAKNTANDKNNETDDCKDGTKENAEIMDATTIRTRKSLRNTKSDDGKTNKPEDLEPKDQQNKMQSTEAKSPTKFKQIESAVIEKVSNSVVSVAEEKPVERSETPVIRTRKALASQDTQINTETTPTMTPEAISPTEEIISETPLMTVTPVENIHEAELSVRTDSMEMNLEPKEVSPKKSTKIVGLSSPPDRKSTNNSCSPSLRPKPTPHLTRGAQFISMIRSKMKSDSTSSSSPVVGFAPSRSIIHMNKFDKRESTPVPEACGPEPLSLFDHTSTPIQKKDFLTFSKRLPSPSASPTASILKRKLRERESIEDTAFDSPASKRKRVSFHDPPVSVTKEYVRDVEENAMKPKRCLSMDKVNAVQAAEFKHSLKRRSKLDSMVEIESFANEPIEKQMSTPPPSTSTSARKMSLTFEEPTEETEKLSMESSPSNLTIKDPIVVVEPDVPDVDTALKVVIEQCSLETVLERYFSDEKTASVKLTDTLAKFVSNCMTTNAKLRSSVLEILSENHSKDFLDHAVQENLSSVVCDRLNLDSVIEYICAKSKLNANCRNNLLAKIPDILKHSKLEKEPFNFIGNLVESMNPADATILDLIANLMRIRHERQSSSQTPYMDSTDVSSSNL